MRYKYQRYDYSRAIKIRSIVPDHFIDSLGMKGKRIDIGKQCRALFFDFLRLVVDDCIENNNKFNSPNRKTFSIAIREKSEWECEHILNNIDKKYKDVDVLRSSGKFYHFVFHSLYVGVKAHRPIRISFGRYKQLIKNVNQGKRYRARKDEGYQS